MHSDRRSEIREQGFEVATMTLPDGRTLECFLENWSPRGACIVYPSTEPIGPRLTLDSEPTGLRRDAVVRWQAVARIGVRFGPGDAERQPHDRASARQGRPVVRTVDGAEAVAGPRRRDRGGEDAPRGDEAPAAGIAPRCGEGGP